MIPLENIIFQTKNLHITAKTANCIMTKQNSRTTPRYKLNQKQQHYLKKPSSSHMFMPHSPPLLTSKVVSVKGCICSSSSKLSSPTSSVSIYSGKSIIFWSKINVNSKNLDSPCDLHKKLTKLIIMIPKNCIELTFTF